MCAFIDPAVQAIRLINHIGDEVANSGQPIRQISDTQVEAAIGAPSGTFATHIVDELHAKDLVTIEHDSRALSGDTTFFGVNLTLEGWQRHNASRRGELSGNYGFVARQFPDGTADPFRLDEFVRDVVRPAVRDALGCDLVDMRDVAEAGVIDNIMRDRIRNARFVVADLTHDNRGAYWEAGYAEGLRKPVVYICERSVFSNVHFDTNHCTTVLWSWDKKDRFRSELSATLHRSVDSDGPSYGW